MNIESINYEIIIFTILCILLGIIVSWFYMKKTVVSQSLVIENTQELLNNLQQKYESLHEEKIDGNDIVILSNFTLKNKNNILSDLNIAIYYQIIDLTTVRDLNKKLPELRKQKNSIYFSTAAGFQGLESKIVIYIDPLEHKISPSSDAFSSMKTEMLAFNAMGRANTILYLLWNKGAEKFYQDKLRILGELVSKSNE